MRSSGSVLSSSHLEESGLIPRIERGKCYQVEGAAVQVGIKEFRTGFRKAMSQSCCRRKLHIHCIHTLSICSLINLLQRVS